MSTSASVRKRSRWHDDDDVKKNGLDHLPASETVVFVSSTPPTLPSSSSPAAAPFPETPRTLQASRSVDCFKKLNRIDEGTYGIVYRAREIATGEIVALKKLKVLHHGKHGFPVTALREIHSLLVYKHRHIVNVREIAIGGNPQSVFIVMEFVDHDIKGVLTSMPRSFWLSEVKTLMLQLLEAIQHLHSNMIIHRDLKTSNLLMNNHGEMKVADFGLARLLTNPPPKSLTKPVVTLWYRAPELLLGASTYTTKVDMWSIGCIFAELLTREPLFPARGEIDMLERVFGMVGRPSPTSTLLTLPNSKSIVFSNFPLHPGKLRSQFSTALSQSGMQLLESLLTIDPENRITAPQALEHKFFSERPLPISKNFFPTFPSRAGGEKRPGSPKAPLVGHGEVDERGADRLSTTVSCEDIAPSSFRLRV